MDYILYYKIREQLIKDYNYLNGGAVTPDISFDENSTSNSFATLTDIPKYEPILPKLVDIEKTINTLKNSTKIDDLQRYIDLYKVRLQEVINKVDPYLAKAQSEKLRFAPDVLVNFFNSTNKFTDLVDTYNKDISKKSWTEERLNNEIYNTQNEENPELLDELFIQDDNNTMEKFNKELLLLFTPFLTKSYNILKDLSDIDKKKELNTNLDLDITNLIELIKLAEKYKDYISSKRKGVETILNTVYNSSDIVTYDNTGNNIKDKKDFLEELKEAQLEDTAKLNISSIFNIQSSLKSVIDGLDINNQMKSIQNFDIFDINVDLKKELSLQNIVSFEGNIMRGGEFDTKFIVTRDTNRKLFKLLELTEKLYLTLDTILNDSKYLQQVQIRYNFYLAYIFLIIRQSASKDIITVFKYLSLDIIQKYLDIFEKIKIKFSSLTPADKNTAYLNKYHYITIDKLINLFRFLKGKISSENILIDVSKCTGNVLNDLNLFNHFKSIIKDYLATSEGMTVVGLSLTEINEIWFNLP